ncbi:MAG: type II secretion system protein GspG [Acidobacteriota bacterium]
MSYCAHCGKPKAAERDFCSVCGKPRPGVRPQTKATTSTGGVVALVVGGGIALIAILGIVSAIFVPNFLDALQKAKQKRTLAEFYFVSEALEAYYLENDTYPNVTTLAALAAALEPEYLESLSRVDGWQQAYRYQCSQSELGGPCDDFRLVSAGKDGVFEQEDPFAYEEEGYPASDYDRDLVYGSSGELLAPQ